MIKYGKITFGGKKLNWDDDLHNIPIGDSRDRKDMVYPDGDISVIENCRALTLINKTLPSATNRCIGSCWDSENNAVIYAVFNSNGQHCIIRFYNNNTFENISYAAYPPEAWNFQLRSPLTMFIIGTGDDAMLFMNDGVNPQRLVNIKNLIDGNYPLLQISEINLLKPSPLKKPTLTLYSNTSVLYNNITNKLFQFGFKPIYDTGQKGLMSHWSDIIYDYGNETIGGDFDYNTSTNNCIIIGIQRDYSNIEKIEIYVKIADIGSGASGTWKLYDTIEITSSTYNYYFYNDKPGTAPVDSVFHLQDEVPFTSQVAKLVDNRIVLGENNVNYDNIDINISLATATQVVPTSTEIVSYPGDPYLGQTTTDIYYAGSNTFTSVYVVLAKVMVGGSPTIDSYEKYYYLYKGALASNASIVAFFADTITNNTSYAGVDATVISTGGSPHILSVNNTNYASYTIYTYTFSAPVLAKALSFKKHSTQKLAICYYDIYGRNGKSQIENLGIYIPRYSSNTAGYIKYFIKYTINHAPPSWAAYYQFMWATNGITSHFTIPVLVYGVFADTADITDDGMIARLDIDAAINRCYEINEGASFNNFSLQKGDKVRIVGYVIDQHTYHYGSELAEATVLGTDDDGKIMITTFHHFTAYSQWGQEKPVWLFQFYRLSSTLESDDIFYYEIGDLIPTYTDANGDLAHQATTVSGSGVTAVNQVIQSSTAAVGVINFGDTYIHYHHFGHRFIWTGYEYRLIPIFGIVESVSSSFMYDSRAIATGRANTYDADNKNETKQSLVYSGYFRSGDLNYNDINRFVNDPVYMDSINGSITGLTVKGDTLRIYQQKKITIFYLNKDEVKYADGSTALITGNNLLSAKNVLPYNVGCSHTYSIAEGTYSDYFYDVRTSAWYRFSQDGLLNITEPHQQNPNAFKMKAYGIYLSKMISYAIIEEDNYYIRGAYDPVKDLYIFTYVNEDYTTQNATLGFHEPSNSWLSFYSFQNEWYFNFNENRFFSMVSGKIYEHHISSTRVATGYIQFHFNVPETSIFRTIELDSDQIWAPSSEWDIILDENATEFQNPDTYEWYSDYMASLLESDHFHYKEGKFMAHFLNNVLDSRGISRGKIYLVQGEWLRGKVISIKLRNIKTDINVLREVIIGYENSK